MLPATITQVLPEGVFLMAVMLVAFGLFLYALIMLRPWEVWFGNDDDDYKTF